MDGKNVGEVRGPLSVRCGARSIRIGSKGTPQKIDVPCGGELTLK